MLTVMEFDKSLRKDGELTVISGLVAKLGPNKIELFST